MLSVRRVGFEIFVIFIFDIVIGNSVLWVFVIVNVLLVYESNSVFIIRFGYYFVFGFGVGKSFISFD